ATTEHGGEVEHLVLEGDAVSRPELVQRTLLRRCGAAGANHIAPDAAALQVLLRILVAVSHRHARCATRHVAGGAIIAARNLEASSGSTRGSASAAQMLEEQTRSGMQRAVGARAQEQLPFGPCA